MDKRVIILIFKIGKIVLIGLKRMDLEYIFNFFFCFLKMIKNKLWLINEYLLYCY